APGDTFELRIDGVVRTDVPGTELEYFLMELGHEDFQVFFGINGVMTSAEPTLDFMIGENKGISDLGAQLEIYDASSGAWFLVDSLSCTFLDARDVFIYDLSVPVLSNISQDFPVDYRYTDG